MVLRLIIGQKKEAPFRGGESVLASRSSRKTNACLGVAFRRRPLRGDSVPLHGPAAREYALPTSGCGSPRGLVSLKTLKNPKAETLRQL